MLGGLIGGGSGRAVAAIGGGLKTREASAMLTLVDNPLGVPGGGLEAKCLQERLCRLWRHLRRWRRRRPGRLPEHGRAR